MMYLAFLGAAIAEIAGCYSFWAWLKLKKSILWLIPGSISLWLFAYLLTFIDSEYAGKAYAAYGAIYILSSIIWMWLVEGNSPNRFDIAGVVICLVGAAVILFGEKF
jgi:small multidrug resistance family-3 protein